MSITQGMVTQARAQSERTMVARCTILRATVSEVRPGYDTETFALLAANVPCYLYNRSGRGELVTPDRSTDLADYRLIVPRDTDVTTADRIGTVTMFGETLLSSVAGVEILDVEPNPAHLVLVLREVD